MTPAEFQQFLAECLDPTTEAGRSVLTPTRVRTPQDFDLAKSVAKLLDSGWRSSKPITLDCPSCLPPCF
jgi:hypothetical protein